MLFRSDRKSTRLNSSHTLISYAVFCLKKNKKQKTQEGGGALHQAAMMREGRSRTPVLSTSRTLAPLRAASPFISFLLFFFFFKERGPPGIPPFPPPRPFPD